MKEPFDVWLEQQLADGCSRLGRRPVRPFSTGRLPRFGIALPAALTAKVVTGLAVAALAAGGGAVLVKSVAPGAFGASVKSHATTTCPQGAGHGACVSSFARSSNPGAAHRSSHAQPGAGGKDAGSSQAVQHGPGAPVATPSAGSASNHGRAPGTGH